MPKSPKKGVVYRAVLEDCAQNIRKNDSSRFLKVTVPYASDCTVLWFSLETAQSALYAIFCNMRSEEDRSVMVRDR